MANRNNAPVQQRSDYDDDDIPEDMDESEVKSRVTGAGTNGNTSSSGGMSLDELDAKGMDEERDEAIRAAMDPPSGDWVKSGRWEWDKRVYSNDSMPDDRDPAGRTIFLFQGEVESRTVGQHTYTPKVYLRMSPDVRFKPDNPDQVDIATKLWLKAKGVYLKVKGENPTIRKLVMFLENDDYIIHTMKGDSGPVPLDVKVKDDKRMARRR